MNAPKETGDEKKALYSVEFQAMLDRIDEEDYADKSGAGQVWMRKRRLCIQQVKALEKHFEEENKLQSERKLKIAEELGLQPRQVSVWFQNRRSRWKSKQLEREYDQLRTSYDALKHDYASLEHEKFALLSQLKDLKAKIEARTLERLNSNEISSLNAPLQASSTSSSCRTTTFDPFPMASSSALDGYDSYDQLYWKAYQNQLLKMEELGMYEDNSCNFFSVDKAPTLHYCHQGGGHFN